MGLGQLLMRSPITAGPSATLAEVAKLMEKENVGAVVITDEERPVGITTDRDLALAVCVYGKSPSESVQDVMTCPVATISVDEGIYNATQKLMEYAVRRLPVVDDSGSLVGLVSLDDLLLLISRELQNVAEGVKAEVGVA
jgi:CBS domain-containing protein